MSRLAIFTRIMLPITIVGVLEGVAYCQGPAKIVSCGDATVHHATLKP